MPVKSFAACVLSGLWAELRVTLIYLFISVCLWFKRKYACHCLSSDTGVTTRCFTQKATMWNIKSNFRTDSCCSLACRQPGPTPSQPKGRSCKGSSGSLRADLPKLVTQLWDSEPASKVCFDRLSAPPPPQQSIHQSRPRRAPELVMCARQLSACGNWRQTKGERQSGPSWQCTGSTADAESRGGSEASTPVPARLPCDVSWAPPKAFSAVVSILGERLQNEVAQWLTTTEGKEAGNQEYLPN